MSLLTCIAKIWAATWKSDWVNKKIDMLNWSDHRACRKASKVISENILCYSIAREVLTHKISLATKIRLLKIAGKKFQRKTGRTKIQSHLFYADQRHPYSILTTCPAIEKWLYISTKNKQKYVNLSHTCAFDSTYCIYSAAQGPFLDVVPQIFLVLYLKVVLHGWKIYQQLVGFWRKICHKDLSIV